MLHRQIKRVTHTGKHQGRAQHVPASTYPHSNVPQQLFSRSRLGERAGVFVKVHCVKCNAHAMPKHVYAIQLERTRRIHTRRMPTCTTHYGSMLFCQERTRLNNCGAPAFWSHVNHTVLFLAQHIRLRTTRHRRNTTTPSTPHIFDAKSFEPIATTSGNETSSSTCYHLKRHSTTTELQPLGKPTRCCGCDTLREG